VAGNVEMLQDRYARFAQGDVEGAVADWTDDFVWDGLSLLTDTLQSARILGLA
jgi:ketosteroid isomerase-like protein